MFVCGRMDRRERSCVVRSCRQEWLKDLGFVLKGRRSYRDETVHRLCWPPAKPRFGARPVHAFSFPACTKRRFAQFCSHPEGRPSGVGSRAGTRLLHAVLQEFVATADIRFESFDAAGRRADRTGHFLGRGNAAAAGGCLRTGRALLVAGGREQHAATEREQICATRRNTPPYRMNRRCGRSCSAVRLPRDAIFSITLPHIYFLNVISRFQTRPRLQTEIRFHCAHVIDYASRIAPGAPAIAI